MSINSMTNKKFLEVKFVLGVGSFSDESGPSVDNSVTWGVGFRINADIKNVGGFTSAEAQLRIFGVDDAQMKQCITIQGFNSSFIGNTVFVTAIDGDVRTLVFAGTVVNCWGRYDDAPNVYLDILARQNYNVAMNNASVRHFPGATPIADIVAIIANSMGLTFNNSENVTTTITDETLKGSDTNQLYNLMKDSGVGIWIAPKSITLTATPRTPFATESVPLISAETGMIGYPTPELFGVSLSCLFNPQIRLGAKIQVESLIPVASGQWFVSSIRHTLTSWDPNPQWKSDIKGSTIATGRD